MELKGLQLPDNAATMDWMSLADRILRLNPGTRPARARAVARLATGWRRDRLSTKADAELSQLHKS